MSVQATTSGATPPSSPLSSTVSMPLPPGRERVWSESSGYQMSNSGAIRLQSVRRDNPLSATQTVRLPPPARAPPSRGMQQPCMGPVMAVKPLPQAVKKPPTATAEVAATPPATEAVETGAVGATGATATAKTTFDRDSMYEDEADADEYEPVPGAISVVTTTPKPAPPPKPSPKPSPKHSPMPSPKPSPKPRPRVPASAAIDI